MKDWNESKLDAILDYINRRKETLMDYYAKAVYEGNEQQADLYQELFLEVDSMHEVTLRIIQM